MASDAQKSMGLELENKVRQFSVGVGRPCPHQMVAVYEFDEDGLIARWRDYLNMPDLTAG